MIKDIFYCPEWLMFVCFCQEGRDMQGKITRVGVGLYLFLSTKNFLENYQI